MPRIPNTHWSGPRARWETIAAAAALLILATQPGCEAVSSRILLDAPDSIDAPKGKPVVEVKDGRADPHVYLAEIDASKPSDASPLTVDPAIEIALERYIYLNLPPITVPLPFSRVDVRIQELLVAKRSGFARADDLTCTIESTLILRRGTARSPMRRIRTEARNRQNTSPRLSTAGKVIVEQCLRQHAIQLIQSVSGS